MTSAVRGCQEKGTQGTAAKHRRPGEKTGEPGVDIDTGWKQGRGMRHSVSKDGLSGKPSVTGLDGGHTSAPEHAPLTARRARAQSPPGRAYRYNDSTAERRRKSRNESIASTPRATEPEQARRILDNEWPRLQTTEATTRDGAKAVAYGTVLDLTTTCSNEDDENTNVYCSCAPIWK